MRSEFIGFRVSEEERKTIEEVAERLQKSLSEAIRVTMLKSAEALEDLGNGNGNPPTGAGTVEVAL
jgi:hypothetical protein